MPSFCKVIILGNLARDPELRVTPKGSAIAQFSLAVNREWKNDAGEKQEKVSFIDCEAWGKTADTIAKYCTKGRPLLVEGRLEQDTWTDKTTQQKRSKLKVVIESFTFVGSRDGGSGNGGGANSDPGAYVPPAGERPAPAPQGDINDEDVPF